MTAVPAWTACSANGVPSTTSSQTSAYPHVQQRIHKTCLWSSLVPQVPRLFSLTFWTPWALAPLLSPIGSCLSPHFFSKAPHSGARELCDPADFYFKNPVCTIVNLAHNFSLSLPFSPQECPTIHLPNFYHCALPLSKLTHGTILKGDWTSCRKWIESCTVNHWSPI